MIGRRCEAVVLGPKEDLEVSRRISAMVTFYKLVIFVVFRFSDGKYSGRVETETQEKNVER